MSTTTILHEFEKHMNERVVSGEIAEATFDSYLNDASRVFETLLRNIPGSVIEGYMKAEGYRGDYRFIIDILRMLAREPGHIAFPALQYRTAPRRGRTSDLQPSLLDPADSEQPAERGDGQTAGEDN
ncbi:MAG: hypothetical protein P8Z40_05305 [Chloroflexota bacterium]|jgi:hypothetical protein